MQDIAQRERRARDLRSQLEGLSPGLEGDVVFQHVRSRHNLVTIYSMESGEAIPIPEYMVGAVLLKRLGDGYMFTDNPDEAPKYRQGQIKCFLHADSTERASGVLNEIGLAGKTCPAGSLANPHSKRIHGQHRHKQEWGAYQEFITDQKEAKAQARQDQQLDATLEIARAAGGQTAPVEVSSPPQEDASPTCNSCGEAIEGKLADHQCK